MVWTEFESELQLSECALVYPDSRLVVGRGSLTPRVVFIGEAPGAEEDKQGIPFVGRSGKMLDEWIAYCGLTESEYYICNVMKSRPPNNRNPTAAEVKLCEPHLHKQLSLLKPQIIVAVGAFAMKHFLPKEKKILSASGKLHGNVFVIPHPSYFIRRGGKGWKPFVTALRNSL